MLQILALMLAMASCIHSQAREITDTAKEAAEMANDIAKKNCNWGIFALKTTTAISLMYSKIYAAKNTQ